MRNQEQQDDEERKQRREEDIRAGRIRVQPPRVQPIQNHFLGEIDGLNWRSGRGSADRASQVRVSQLSFDVKTLSFVRS